MSERLRKLSGIRDRLIAKAAMQRTALTRNIGPLRAPISLVDQVLSTLRFISRHPVWVMGGAVMLAAGRAGRGGKLLGGGLLAWQVIHALRSR